MLQVGLLSYSFASNGAIEVVKAAEADLHVILLIEGTWPRGILATHAANQPTNEQMTEVAGDLLRRFRSPQRWQDDLTAFLFEAVRKPVADDPVLSIIHLRAELDDAIEDGDSKDIIWDFISGRRFPVGELPTRPEAYASSIANIGDVDLDTRFQSKTYVMRWPGEDPIPELAEALYVTGSYVIPLLDLEPAYDEFLLVREFTVRSWINVNSLGVEVNTLGQELANELHDAFWPENYEEKTWKNIQTLAANLLDLYRRECDWLVRRQKSQDSP